VAPSAVGFLSHLFFRWTEPMMVGANRLDKDEVKYQWHQRVTCIVLSAVRPPLRAAAPPLLREWTFSLTGGPEGVSIAFRPPAVSVRHICLFIASPQRWRVTGPCALYLHTAFVCSLKDGIGHGW